MISLDYSLLLIIVLFIILMRGLDRSLFQPVTGLLEERESKTRGRLKKAAELDERIKHKLADYEEKLHAARVEIAQYQAKIRQEAEAQRDAILERAKQDALEALTQARGQLQEELENLRPGLQSMADQLSASLSTRIFPS